MEKERKDALEMAEKKKKKNEKSAEEARRKAMTGVVVGIDLAGSEKRPTGFCIMDLSLNARTSILYTDSQILHEVTKTEAKIVCIDAPLSLPKGRKSIEDRFGPHFRVCDMELRKRHIRFFPITLGPMRMLTERGIRIKKRLEGMGFRVFECFPGGAQDALNMPRKQEGLNLLARALRKHGIKGLKPSATGDELDAATCALVGVDYVLGKYEKLGEESEGIILMPKP
ncbi:MAG: DUF429 domain-containing protein [Candidatus Micrarchaeia archaeon]